MIRRQVKMHKYVRANGEEAYTLEPRMCPFAENKPRGDWCILFYVNTEVPGHLFVELGCSDTGYEVILED